MVSQLRSSVMTGAAVAQFSFCLSPVVRIPVAYPLRFNIGEPRPLTRIRVSSPPNKRVIAAESGSSQNPTEETVFFDGGTHYGDLLVNLLLGFTLLWLPLTVAAVSRAFFLRYRFTNLRVSVVSGLTGQERSDFSYKVIKDVQVVPRLIGEWGDIVITLKDGTKVDLRSVPKFREIAKYCQTMAGATPSTKETGPRGF